MKIAINTKCFERLFLFSLFILCSNVLKAQNSDLEPVQSILDRLEERLSDFEKDQLGIPNNVKNDFKIDSKNAREDKIDASLNIIGTSEEYSNMQDITKALKKLESQINNLSSDVHKVKQQFLDEAKIDSFVEIQVKLASLQNYGIKTLSLKLDGYEVFELHEESSFWMPEDKIPIYAGPLHLGKHRIDVEAKLVMKKNNSIPINTDLYHFINKSFDIVVPDEKFSKRYVLSIEAPEKNGEKSKISLLQNSL
ncbi:MAG: hypothetical protein R3B45_02655 [Bdellovibrionota bacterium]